MKELEKYSTKQSKRIDELAKKFGENLSKYKEQSSVFESLGKAYECLVSSPFPFHLAIKPDLHGKLLMCAKCEETKELWMKN